MAGNTIADGPVSSPTIVRSISALQPAGGGGLLGVVKRVKMRFILFGLSASLMDGHEAGASEAAATESPGTETGGTEASGTESAGTAATGTKADGTEAAGTLNPVSASLPKKRGAVADALHAT